MMLPPTVRVKCTECIANGLSHMIDTHATVFSKVLSLVTTVLERYCAIKTQVVQEAYRK
jgi:hypothetical protein